MRFLTVKLIIDIFSKRNFLIVFCLPLLLVGCATNSVNVSKDLLLSKSGYIKSETIAYQWFGVGRIHLFGGPKNVTKDEPTRFHINMFVVDNEGCKIIYYAKDGKKLESTKSASLYGYLSDENILVKVICKGDNSNIDYKIQAVSDGIEYSRSGSLYYFRA